MIHRRRFNTLLAVLAVGVALLILIDSDVHDRRRLDVNQERSSTKDKMRGGVLIREGDKGKGCNEMKPTQLTSPPGTIVTAYFNIKSKRGHTRYSEWMVNMLSLHDPMVIYTTPDMVSTIEKLRSHALALTKVIPMELNETKMAEYGEEFWEHQHDMDPEKDIHRSYLLYWIWNEKLEFLRKTIEENPFQSNFFAWVDIGHMRRNEFNHKVMLQQIPTTLKDDQIIGVDVSHITRISHYMCGCFIGGYKAGIMRLHNVFYTLLEANKHRFIGKDQDWFAKACTENEDLCMLVKPGNDYYGNHWFFMAPYMMGMAKCS